MPSGLNTMHYYIVYVRISLTESTFLTLYRFNHYVYHHKNVILLLFNTDLYIIIPI